MVEDVEELASETEPDLLGDVKLPLQCKIHLRCSETAQHIVPEIALLSAGRWRESGMLKTLPPGLLRAEDLEWREPSYHRMASES